MNRRWITIAMRGVWAPLAIVGLAAPVLLGLGGCSSTKKAFKPSVAQQVEVGQKAATEVPKQYKVVTGAAKDRVQRIGAKLVSALPAAERDRWKFQFNVVEDKELNAFALPGGPIYLFTGLLNKMNDDSEVAAVLGHEMAHVYKQHWAEQVAEDQQRSAGLLVLLGALDADKGWYTAADVLNTVVGLRYSRKHEDEADREGLYNMVAAGYNPQGMVELFRTLETGGGGSTPAFLRSHPITSDRIKKTQERIAAMEKP